MLVQQQAKLETNSNVMTVPIIGIPIFKYTIPHAVQHCLQLCENEKPANYCISATGAHGMVFARKNSEFRKVLQSFYLNLPDGMPGVWVGRLKGAKEMKRCYGPDFFEAMMIASADKSIQHFLCGGKDGVADQLKQACGEKFNNYNIAGTFCPPFQPLNEIDFKAIAEKINASGANIVWIGISTPRQEMFAKKLAALVNVHFIITVGAAFDFHIGGVRQAPKYIQKSGLEWLFRLLMEPGRLFKRYFEIVPSFIYYNLQEYFSYLLKLPRNKLNP